MPSPTVFWFSPPLGGEGTNKRPYCNLAIWRGLYVHRHRATTSVGAEKGLAHRCLFSLRKPLRLAVRRQPAVLRSQSVIGGSTLGFAVPWSSGNSLVPGRGFAGVLGESHWRLYCGCSGFHAVALSACRYCGFGRFRRRGRPLHSGSGELRISTLGIALIRAS